MSVYQWIDEIYKALDALEIDRENGRDTTQREKEIKIQIEACTKEAQRVGEHQSLYFKNMIVIAKELIHEL